MGKIGTKIMNSIKRVRFYWQDYFKSMLFLQGLKTIIILPVLSGIFILMLQRAKIVGLTDATMVTLLHTPSALILGLLWLVIFTYAVFYELGYYFLMADNHMKGYEADYKENFKRLNKKIKYFFSSHLILFFGYFLLILPLVSLGFQSDLLESIKIPDFIVDELSMTSLGSLFMSLAGILMLYLSFRLLYVIYFFVITPSQTILSAIKESWHFSRGRFWRNVCIIGSLILLIGVVIAIAIFVMTLPLMLTDFIIPKVSPIIAGVVITGIQLVLFFIGGLLQPLLANGVVETTRGEVTPFSMSPKRNKQSFGEILKKNKLTTVSLILVLVGLIGVNSWSVMTVVYQPQTTIVAHRGFMEKGVENSLGSLRAAAEVGADMVEMDIQETKDGQFVVIHDYNLKRLAGLDQEVRKMTLKELQKVKLSQNGFTDHIPSLKEYIDEAKSLNMKLLIEVKPHGYESEAMCDNLIKILKDKQVLNWFSVQSLDKPILDELKIKEPRLQTGYIIPLNFGHLPDTIHNFYVLEEFSVTEDLIEEAKDLKKGLFVWTVNKDDLLKQYLRLDVDGIISNHPDRAVLFRESREETETFLNRVLFLLEN